MTDYKVDTKKKMQAEIQIKALPEQRQRYLMNCALECLESDGREFEPKIDNLSLLINIVGIDTLKEHYRKKYNAIKNKIDELIKDTAILISYFSDIDKRVVSREDITSQRFLRYQESLSNILNNLFLIDEVTIILLNKTDLKDLTIPATYWSVLATKEKKMPITEEERDTITEEIRAETGEYPREFQRPREYTE